MTEQTVKQFDEMELEAMEASEELSEMELEMVSGGMLVECKASDT